MTPEDKKPATGLPPKNTAATQQGEYVRKDLERMAKGAGVILDTPAAFAKGVLTGDSRLPGGGLSGGFGGPNVVGAVSEPFGKVLNSTGQAMADATVDFGRGVLGIKPSAVPTSIVGEGARGDVPPASLAYGLDNMRRVSPAGQPAQTPALPPVAPTAPVTPTTNPATKTVAPLTGDKLYDKANGIAEYVGKSGERAFSNIRPEDRDKGGNFTVMDSSGLRATPYYKQAVAELAGQGLPQVAPQNQIITIGENGGFGFDKPDPAKQRIQAIDMAAKDMAAKAGISAPTPGMIKAATAMYQSYDDLTNANTVASTSRANKQDDVMLGREGFMSEEGRAQAKAITDMLLRQDANANALQVAGLGNIGKVEAAKVSADKSKGLIKPFTNYAPDGSVSTSFVLDTDEGQVVMSQAEMQEYLKQKQQKSATPEAK